MEAPHRDIFDHYMKPSRRRRRIWLCSLIKWAFQNNNFNVPPSAAEVPLCLVLFVSFEGVLSIF